MMIRMSTSVEKMSRFGKKASNPSQATAHEKPTPSQMAWALLFCYRNWSIGRQKSKATRLAAAGTAACGGTRADMPSAAKQMLHYFPEGQ
jgi:hypothetical protein